VQGGDGVVEIAMVLLEHGKLHAQNLVLLHSRRCIHGVSFGNGRRACAFSHDNTIAL